MTKAQAIRLFDTEWWKSATPEQIVSFQLQEDRLCMPFGEFHGAVEKVFKRGVFTHEFAYRDRMLAQLWDHLEGGAKPVTLDDILALIPEGKRLVVLTP